MDRTLWTPTEHRNHARRTRARSPDLAEALGMLMRLWRWQAAMTLDEVAAGMDSYWPIVARLEAGHHIPKVESLVRHARATGGDVHQAFALVDAWLAPETLRRSG